MADEKREPTDGGVYYDTTNRKLRGVKSIKMPTKPGNMGKWELKIEGKIGKKTEKVKK